jgi:GntR family transcriptional repressor for pyruvate dehydrogenase complex
MSVTSKAIAEIKRLIVTGELAPGERLPPEGPLATQLGISRSSLREAVRALSAMGVLDVRRGDGTFVTSLEPDLLLRGTGFVVDLLQGQEPLELLAVRRLLEPAATALAAYRLDEEELESLRESLERMAEAADVEEFVEIDDAFHGTIVGSTGRPLLVALVRSLSGHTLRARIWRGLIDEGAAQETLRGHRAIVKALEARDAELAHAAAAMHIADVERWLSAHLGADDEGGRP